MTEQTIKPGWYVINSSLGMTVLWRGEEFWSGRNPEWPDMARPDLPSGWTLGPRVEDLLRDAERYRWLRDHYSYVIPMVAWDEPSPAECGIEWHWQQSKANETPDIDVLIDAEIAQEKEDDHG